MSLRVSFRVCLFVLVLFLVVAASAAAGTVRLSWNPSATATGYRVHYGTESESYTTVIDVGDATTYLFEDLEDCTRYYMTTTAYNEAGASGYSEEVSSLARPAIGGALPGGAEQGRQLEVTFSGANFDTGAAVELSGSGLQVESATAAECGVLVVNLAVSETAQVGPSDVSVVNPSGALGTAAGVFTVSPAVAPGVSSTEPGDGSDGVSIGVHPSVQFSEPLSAATVSTATVRLLDEGGQPVAQDGGSPTLSPDGTTVTLVPAAPLEQGHTYRIQVLGGAAGVADLAGHGLVADFLMATGFQTEGDSAAPQITDVQAMDVGWTTARIGWTTDENADSQVFYRELGAQNYRATSIDPAAVLEHDVDLQGLSPETTYEFHVRSADESGNEAFSDPDGTFTTEVSPYLYLEFEAELGTNADPVEIAEGPDAFGGAWIGTPAGGPGSADEPLGTSTYGIYVPWTGTWHLWVRVRSDDGGPESWFESMNGEPREPLGAAAGSWQWVAGRSRTLSSGLHDLELGGHAGGARADRIVLTDDPEFVPGAEPGEDVTPPGSVLELAAAPGDQRVDLSWVNPDDEDLARVVVRYRTDGRFPVSPVDGFHLVNRPADPGIGDGHAHTNLGNGVTYYYRVFALDESGNVAAAAGVAAIPAPALQPPAAPDGLTLN